MEKVYKKRMNQNRRFHKNKGYNEYSHGHEILLLKPTKKIVGLQTHRIPSPLLFAKLIVITPNAGLQAHISFIFPIITQFLILRFKSMPSLRMKSHLPEFHIVGYYGQYNIRKMRSDTPDER